MLELPGRADPPLRRADARGIADPNQVTEVSGVKLMGIVNVTPDSFSDGGLFLDPNAAVEHGRDLAGEGADVLDVGGESTRPGAGAVEAEEELSRITPVVERLTADRVASVSIDTS